MTTKKLDELKSSQSEEVTTADKVQQINDIIRDMQQIASEVKADAMRIMKENNEDK
mgnify:CR=1 FL=1